MVGLCRKNTAANYVKLIGDVLHAHRKRASLGQGMLFRGELLVDCTEDDAKAKSMELSDYWAEVDADDEADSQVE